MTFINVIRQFHWLQKRKLKKINFRTFNGLYKHGLYLITIQNNLIKMYIKNVNIIYVYV